MEQLHVQRWYLFGVNLTKGNAAYTLVQVAVNDIILLVGFVPIVALLLGVTDVTVPWDNIIIISSFYLL